MKFILLTCLWVGCWLGGGAAQAEPAGPDQIYEDLAAGVRFVVPLHRPHIKSAGQILGLIGHDPQAPRWPEHLELSGGVYSGAGWPYILVWTQDYSGELTQRRADRLARETADELEVAGWSAWRWDRRRLRGMALLKNEAGHRAQILVTIGRGRIFYVALYYRQPADRRFFRDLVRDVELTPEYQLTRSELPAGSLLHEPWAWLAGFVVLAGGGVSIAFARRS